MALNGLGMGERHYIATCTATRGICHECVRESVRHVDVRSWRMVVQKGDAAALVDEGTTIMLDQIQ